MRALAGSKQLHARERCETSPGRFAAFARRRPKAASPLNAAASPAWRLAASQGNVPGVDPDMLACYDLGHEAERLFTWGRLERVRTEQLLAATCRRRPRRCWTSAAAPASTRSGSPRA